MVQRYYENVAVVGRLDGPEADSSIGHIRLNDGVDAHPVMRGALSHKRDACNMPDTRPAAVGANNILCRNLHRPALRVLDLNPHLVIVHRVVNGKVLELGSSDDFPTSSFEAVSEDVLRVLLADVETVVEVRVVHPADKVPAAPVDPLAVFEGCASAPDEADLVHRVGEVELV